MRKILVSSNYDFNAELEIADTFMTRLAGLMFRSSLPDGKALLLANCASIHTCFMRFLIDVVYLDSEYTILGKETIKPWQIGKRFRGTKIIIEMNQGAARNLQIGDQLIVCESDSSNS